MEESIIELTNIAEGPRVEMTDIYRGQRGTIVAVPVPGKAYDVKLEMGIHVITGSHNFKRIARTKDGKEVRKASEIQSKEKTKGGLSGLLENVLRHVGKRK